MVWQTSICQLILVKFTCVSTPLELRRFWGIYLSLLECMCALITGVWTEGVNWLIHRVVSLTRSPSLIAIDSHLKRSLSLRKLYWRTYFLLKLSQYKVSAFWYDAYCLSSNDDPRKRFHERQGLRTVGVGLLGTLETSERSNQATVCKQKT